MMPLFSWPDLPKDNCNLNLLVTPFPFQRWHQLRKENDRLTLAIRYDEPVIIIGSKMI